MKCSDGILDKTRSRGNSPCLLVVGMEAVLMAALGHGQGSGGEIRARSLCPKPKELEGSRRREGGLGVQWLQFLDNKRSRGKLTLPFCSGNASSSSAPSSLCFCIYRRRLLCFRKTTQCTNPIRQGRKVRAFPVFQQHVRYFPQHVLDDHCLYREP